MNQEKIGKFIAAHRKKQGMTQSRMAELLGVSDRTVGNWENGRNMPDISLFEPLCQILDISITEFLKGEENTTENDEELESSLLSTINYSKKLILKKDKIIGYITLIIGSSLFFGGLLFDKIFVQDGIYNKTLADISSQKALICLFGIYFSASGLHRILKDKTKFLRSLVPTIFAISLFVFSIGYDYQKVENGYSLPLWSYTIDSYRDIRIHRTPLYNLYIIHPDTIDAYTIFDNQKKLDINSIKKLPFDEDAQLTSLLECNNEIDCELSKLPLNTMNSGHILSSTNLIVDYGDETAQFEVKYIKKTLIYNALTLFLLHKELTYIKFILWHEETKEAFKYEITRAGVEDTIKGYKDISKKENEKYDELLNAITEDDITIENFFSSLFQKSKLTIQDFDTVFEG